jgi:hypothetical protein
VKSKDDSMNIVANFEYRASSSRGKHEGESSFALCDRLSRTRDNSQRQLPTDHDYAVPTREYQTDQSSLKTDRLLLALSSRKRKDNYKNIPTDFAVLTWSLHIRSMHSSTSVYSSVTGQVTINALGLTDFQ